MTIFFISFGITTLAILGLAIGVLTGRGPLSTGGCGGIGCHTAGFGCKASLSSNSVKNQEGKSNNNGR